MAEDAIKDLKKSLYRSKESTWARVEHDQVRAFAEEYMAFLAKAKTERAASREIVKRLEEAGFVDAETAQSIAVGDRIYLHYREKAVIALVIGDPEEVRIIGSHLDSPRLDLKPNPLIESEGLALFKTHYYGGVKKYQWTNTDLALYGVIHTKDGVKHELCLGESPGEPRLLVSDLLPHLAQKQLEKNGKELVEAEQLAVYAANIPYPLEGDESSVKLALLKHLNETYGLVEEDFGYAELTLVPAGTPSFIGFDKSLIGAYGHDDKVCAYTSLRALIETKNPAHTALALFIDKEEIGSDGDTGAQSYALARMLESIYAKLETDRSRDVLSILHDAKALSADVTAAIDPNFPDVHDVHGAPRVGRGLVIEKYTGAGGKYSANDASAEYLAQIRAIMNAHEVPIQASGGLGKVDLGGGGTIAKFLSRYGTRTVDAGPAVLGMHAPREIISTIDVYGSYLAYKAFYQ
jgi:aspartyl aminopeptidase